MASIRGWVILIVLSSSLAFAQSWVLKVSGAGLGNPLTANPLNTDIIYGAAGNNYVLISRNRGYTWNGFGNSIPGGGIIKVIMVNPLDTLQFLAGVEMGGANPDRIMKSTDAGMTWAQTWGGTFSYYGKPVEFEPVHPDTVYTMGNDTLWRSTNFGSTWDTVRTVVGFNAWCDGEVRPDSANIMYIGDNSSGIWKSTNYGASWRNVFSTPGEIPSIAIDPLNPRVAYASRYNGGGGLLKSTDWGETWHQITTPVGTGFTWWVTCSPVMEGHVYFGTYGASVPGIFMSKDSGLTWQKFDTGLYPYALLNYGLLTLDTLTVIALQQNGLYKLQYPLAIHVLSPNGGEAWPNGTQQTISWSDSGLFAVKLEFTTDAGVSWNLIANNIPATQTSYLWNVPILESNACRIRISDAKFTSTKDASDSYFTIYTPNVTLNSPSGGETWIVGSTQDVTWNVSGPVYVSLNYSTDDGLTWNYIARRPAYTGAYSWVIPNTPSTQCRVRVRSDYDTTRADTSASSFTIARRVEFGSAIVIADGPTADTLAFGIQAGATDSIDAGLGENVLSPKPPSGTFDARWKIGGTNGTQTDYRDTLGDVSQQRQYVMEFQPGPAGYPVSLAWDPLSLATGVFTLRDTLTHGGNIAVDMKKRSSLVVSDTSVSAMEIIHSKGLTIVVGANGGWSLMSLPVRVVDRKTGSIFPYASSSAYVYQTGYRAVDSLQYGVGNWLRTDPLSITGIPLTNDTVDVHPRWNMIGSLSYPLPTSSVVSIPDTLIASPYYDYSSGQGYQPQTSLIPGKGYWLKTKGSGQLVLSSGPSLVPKLEGTDVALRHLNTLTVEDAEHHSQTLFFGEDSSGLSEEYFELPPSPDGVFDARFSNGGMLRLYSKTPQNNVETAIFVHTHSNTIIFSWSLENEEKLNYILLERKNGAETVKTPLKNCGRLFVSRSNEAAFFLRVAVNDVSKEVPQKFLLEQNYPNPFNPTSTIEFSLPVPASVTLKVYNVIGQNVATLFDRRDLAAGIYSCEIDAGQLASGVYFYRLTANGVNDTHARNIFQSVKKMAVVK